MMINASLAEVLYIDPKRVRPFKEQPRIRFRGIDQLGDSIVKAGQQETIKVFRIDEDRDHDFELIDGERRLKACAKKNIQVLAMVLPERPPWREQYVRSVAANFARQDHDAVEKSDAAARLIEAGFTQAEIGEICGHTQAWVSQHLSLQKLHPEVRALMIAPDDNEEFRDDVGRKLRRKAPLSFQIALLLIDFPHAKQKKLAKEVQGKTYGEARRIVLRAREEAGIERRTRSVSPNKRLAKLESALQEIDHALSPYLDMAKPKFLALFSAADRATVRKIAGMMEESAFHLSKCGDLLSEIVDKPLKALKA